MVGVDCSRATLAVRAFFCSRPRNDFIAQGHSCVLAWLLIHSAGPVNEFPINTNGYNFQIWTK